MVKPKFDTRKYDAKSEKTFCDSIPSKVEYGFQENAYKWTYSEVHLNGKLEKRKDYTKRYTPDINFKTFDLELKGYLRPDAKKRMEAFKEMYPDVDLRIAFQVDKPTSKGSKRKYTDWARLKGFKACVAKTYDDLPIEWRKELEQKKG